VHPNNYGSANMQYANAPETFNEARDRFETQVFVLSQQYQKPLLGICRGMQLLNCILGGSLTQDLGEDGNSIHRNTGIDKRHPLTIKDGTMLQQLAGLTTTDTNSAHHQCIDRLGDGLRVSAVSPDGIIEAVEWSDPVNKPYLLGVQWHPERMYKINMQDSVLSTQVRSHFLNAVQQYAFGDTPGGDI
jgi:putative glutamine amidotransferase